MPNLPYNYAIMEGDAWKPGSLAGSSEPGGGSSKSNEKVIISMFQRGESFENVISPELLSHLDAIYEKGARTIYNLTLPPSELSRYIWKNMFSDTKYITEINGTRIAIEDFHPPTQEQLQIISDDAFKRMKNGENVLVHCHGGLGRTGTILTAIYMKSQEVYDARAALNYVRENYNSYAVETRSQMSALKTFGNLITAHR